MPSKVYTCVSDTKLHARYVRKAREEEGPRLPAFINVDCVRVCVCVFVYIILEVFKRKTAEWNLKEHAPGSTLWGMVDKKPISLFVFSCVSVCVCTCPYTLLQVSLSVFHSVNHLGQSRHKTDFQLHGDCVIGEFRTWEAFLLFIPLFSCRPPHPLLSISSNLSSLSSPVHLFLSVPLFLPSSPHPLSCLLFPLFHLPPWCFPHISRYSVTEPQYVFLFLNLYGNVSGEYVACNVVSVTQVYTFEGI